MTIFRAMLLVLVALLATPIESAASPAYPATELAIAYGDNTGPCSSSNPVTVIWDEAMTEEAGAAGLATGVDLGGWMTPDDKSDDWYVLRKCEIAMRPSIWRKPSKIMRCEYIDHEVKHLFGFRHEDPEMNPRSGFSQGCLAHFGTLSQRAIDYFMRWPGVTNALCTAGHKISRCDVEFGHKTAVSYRVRHAGHAITAGRVR